MTFISQVRLEGTVSRIQFLTAKSSGNEYCILRLEGPLDQDTGVTADCEVKYFGYSVADCHQVSEGDYAVITGSISVRVTSGREGGHFFNPQITGNAIRKISRLPIEGKQTEGGPITPESIPSSQPADDWNDLPF